MNDRFFITTLPRYSMIIYIILNITAMLMYAGGNINDHSQEGYSLIRNFFSDLGRRYSLAGDSNLISCVLFNSSLTVVGLTFMILFYKVRSIFLKDKILILLATTFGIFSGFSYMGVGFTPADLYLEAHIFFAHWAFRALFAALIISPELLTLTSRKIALFPCDL